MFIHSFGSDSGKPPDSRYWVFLSLSGGFGEWQFLMDIFASQSFFIRRKITTRFLIQNLCTFLSGNNKMAFYCPPVSFFLKFRKTEDPIRIFLIIPSSHIERSKNTDQFSTSRYCPVTMKPCGSTVTIDRKMELTLKSHPEENQKYSGIPHRCRNPGTGAESVCSQFCSWSGEKTSLKM